MQGESDHTDSDVEFNDLYAISGGAGAITIGVDPSSSKSMYPGFQGTSTADEWARWRTTHPGYVAKNPQHELKSILESIPNISEDQRRQWTEWARGGTQIPDGDIPAQWVERVSRMKELKKDRVEKQNKTTELRATNKKAK